MKNSFQKIKRYWRTGLSYGLGLQKSITGPITVHIETTNICNFRCIYCPQSNQDEHFKILGRGKMSFDEFKIILNKILKPWPIKEIVLTRDGEPLVHPDLAKFIEYASEAGLDITIGSNGSYFTELRVRELIDNGLTKVKGDFCADKTKYEQLRSGGKWEDVLDGYRTLLKYAHDQRKKFHLVLVDLNTYGLTDSKKIQLSLKELQELFPFPENYLSIGPAMMHNAFDEAQVILSTSNKLQTKKYNRCHHPWIELVIDYKGNAVGCCRDLRSEYILGNILTCENVVRDIWNGEPMRYLREHLKNKKPENITICNKCDLPYGVSYAGRGILNKYLRFLQR
jgi:radical SAM protein with 4Fe4S-binding SPASM domain